MESINNHYKNLAFEAIEKYKKESEKLAQDLTNNINKIMEEHKEKIDFYDKKDKEKVDESLKAYEKVKDEFEDDEENYDKDALIGDEGVNGFVKERFEKEKEDYKTWETRVNNLMREYENLKIGFKPLTPIQKKIMEQEIRPDFNDKLAYGARLITGFTTIKNEALQSRRAENLLIISCKEFIVDIAEAMAKLIFIKSHLLEHQGFLI